MSYLVLARKYRPQTFDEIVGQEHVTRTLANAFARGRVHHAFLFCGARGVGKTTAARVLARALCCESGPTPTPCGVCSPCTTITAGSAVDYFEIDGASNNSVDDIRELRDGVKYQPAQLKRKIYIIDEVHMLSTAAFNALLKTLEEPPPHVTFVFATTEVHKIPVTILSRCQRYDFKLVPVARLVAQLQMVLGKESIVYEQGALALLAREAGGSVRDALSLADQVIAYAGDEPLTEARVAEVLGVADRKLLLDLARAVTSGDARGALTAVDAAEERGVDLAQLARTFLAVLRDLAVVGEIAEPGELVEGTADELAVLREIVRGTSAPALRAHFDRFARACEELRESTAPRLVLDVALLDMAAGDSLAPVAELIERLEGVERRLRGGGGGTGSGPTRGAAPSGPSRGAPSGAAPPPRSDAPPPRSWAPAAAAPPRGATADVARAAPAASRAPAAPPAPLAPVAVPSEPMAEWERAVVALYDRAPLVAGLFEHALLLGWTEAGIELGFADGTFQARQGTDPEQVRRLEQLLGEQLGGALKIRTRTVDAKTRAAAGSVVDTERTRRAQDRAEREAEAREHPTTQALADVFGATITEIKSL